MAEFCLRCMNKMDGTSLTKEDVILEFALCEECSKVMPCVVRYRTWPERVIRNMQKHCHMDYRHNKKNIDQINLEDSYEPDGVIPTPPSCSADDYAISRLYILLTSSLPR